MPNQFSQPDSGEFVEQEIHLRDYVRILLKRKYLVLTVLIVVFLTATVKTYTTTPIYSAASQVLIERNYGSKGFDTQYFRYEPEFLDTQAEIIKSVNVARKVVDRLQLASRYRDQFFRESRASFSITGAIRGWFGDLLRPLQNLLRGEAEEGGEQTAALLAESIAPKTEEEMITSMVQGGLQVTPVKNTKIVAISYSHRNPLIAKLVADAVVQAYMDELLEIKLATSSYSVKWMTDKAEEEREKLEHSERQLQQFMRENDLVTVEDRMTILPQKLSEFGSQISRAEAEKKELQDLLSQIKAAGGDLEKLEKIPNLASSEVLKSIRERIYKAEQTIQELSKKYGPKHPRMIKANDELRSLQDEKRFEIDRVVATITNSYELAASKEASLKELLAETKSNMLNLNEKFMQYQIMKREVDANRVMYETLQTGIKTESVTEQSQSVNIWVTRKAELPLAPSSPNTRRNLMLGFLLGLFGGVGLAFFIEYLDNTVKSAQQLEERYGLSVLGIIEELRGKDKNIENFVTNNPLSPLTESYRLIRSGLLLSSPDHPPRTILVTSMGEKEGKTSTVANIARVLAQAGSRVLVVDCDLRRPRLHQVFGLDGGEDGLSTLLSGGNDAPPVRDIPGEAIAIVTSGPIPPAPAELLGSERMHQFVAEMAERFDFVLLDSPPVQSVTDSLALSRFVDGTVVVVRAGRTSHEMLDNGMKKLREVKAHFLGFVLNGLRSQDVGRYYYGYSSYYSRSDEQE